MVLFESAFTEKNLGHSELLLQNCFIRSAAYEGMLDHGLPNQDLVDHHVAMARGGVALTTVSYGAVSANGRTFNTQMYINDRSLEKLKVLADEVHKAGGKVSMQLTHCGYFSKNKDSRRPLAPSRIFNAYGSISGIMFSKAMTLADMEEVANDFAEAALKLKEIGFDAVEIHMGHGYLLSQFLSPRTNKRKDTYGGSIENRSRFPLELVRAVIEKVGNEFPILVKPPLKTRAEHPSFSSSFETYLQSSREKPLLKPSARFSLTSTGNSFPTLAITALTSSSGNLDLFSILPP